MAAMDTSAVHHATLNSEHQVPPEFWGDYENFLFEAYTNEDIFEHGRATNVVTRRRSESHSVNALDLDHCDEGETTAGSTLSGNHHGPAPTPKPPREPCYITNRSAVKADISSHAALAEFRFSSSSPKLASSPGPSSPANVLGSTEPLHFSKSPTGLSMEQPVSTRSVYSDPWADRLEKSVVSFAAQDAPLSPPPSSRFGSGDEFDILQGQSMPRTMAYSSSPVSHIPHGNYYGFTPAGSPSLDPDPFGDKAEYLNTSPHYTTATNNPSMPSMTSPQAFDGAFTMEHNQPSVQPWWPLPESSNNLSPHMDSHYQHRQHPQRSLSTYANPSDLSNNGLMISMPNQHPANGHHRSLSLSNDRQSFAPYTNQTSAPPVPPLPRSRPPTTRHQSQPYPIKYRSPSPSKTPNGSRRSVSKHYSSTAHSSSSHPAGGHHRRSRTTSSITPTETYDRRAIGPHLSPSSSQHSNGNNSSIGDFVNFTPADSSKILTGVAPSGSSKTKARREKEAAERRKRTFQAAARVILANGGDVKELEREGLGPYI